MIREIEEVKEELGLNKDQAKELSFDKRIESIHNSKDNLESLERYSKSQDLEGSIDR